jgi:hypothetical protein
VTAVEKYFFTPIYYPRSAWSVIRWWESRRLLYNACVGATGLVSITAGTLLASLPPSQTSFGLPWEGMLVFGVLANVGYSLGAPVDLLLRRILGERAPAVAPALFRYGFVFSVGVALLPLPLGAISWLLRWIF